MLRVSLCSARGAIPWRPSGRTPTRRLLVTAVLLLAGIPALSGASTPAWGAELRVAAASSLQGALRAVNAAYAAGGSDPATLVFGASGSLARQLENGAPYDIFAAADAAWIAPLVRGGLIAADSVRAYAQGRLALASRNPALFARAVPEAGALLDAAALRGVLRGGRVGWRVRFLAMANPAVAPYGAAARQALQDAGLWRTIVPRLVYGESVRHVLTYVETGNADAGFVAVSLLGAGGEAAARRAAPAVHWRELDPALYTPIVQVLGIRAGTPQHAEAEHFVAFLLSPPGRAILTTHGLAPPPAQG